MNIDHLRTFVILAELRNFTQTAAKQYIVQSTVTNRIAELEKELGVSLFIRNNKSVTLTEEGSHLLEYAKRMIQLEDHARMEIQNMQSYKQVIRLGCVNTVYDCYLYPKISSFLKSHSDISLSLVIDHSNALATMLQDQTLDVIITYVPFNKAGFHCIPYTTDQLVLVTAPSNETFPEGINKEQLSQINYLYCNYILEEDDTFLQELFENRKSFSFELDKGSKLKPYLLDGLGYSFMPRNLVTKELKKQKLIEIPLLDFDAPTIQSYLIYSKKRDDLEVLIKGLGM